jgi:TnpA family transposase
VILSDATNIGLKKIADATPGRTYAKLSWVADWYVREEHYAKALAEIVRQQHQVPLAAQWGSGTTSSSDGQALPIATRKPVLAQANGVLRNNRWHARSMVAIQWSCFIKYNCTWRTSSPPSERNSTC